MKKDENIRFKFSKEKNKFRWGSDAFYIEYSNPSIQGHYDYIKLKSIKEIMYYYYSFKIFKKDINGKNILVSEIDTHDFPSITNLKKIIEYFIEKKTLENYQVDSYEDNENFYSKRLQTDDVFCDDFYELTKYIKKENKKTKYELYTLYCGTTTNPCSFSDSTNGLRINNINKKELLELYKCINEFVKYSLFIHNKKLAQKDIYKIVQDKIYCFKFSKDKNNNLNRIYIKGDILSSLTTVIDNKEEDYSDAYLIDIKDDNLILSFVHNKKEKFSININDIVYMCHYPTDKELMLSKEGVAENFVSILNNDEKEEFKSLDIKNLIKKYKEPIIDRTWLYRDEHGFNLNYENREQQMNKIVFDIINIIINKIKEEVK